MEKSKTDNFLETNKRKSFWALPFLCVGLFFLTLMQFPITMGIKLFFIFPILGVLFSIAALKDLFGTKSELLNSFCYVTATTSCNAVVGSNKWKIFEIVNFSDLSMVFYSSQFLGLLLFLFMRDVKAYFAIQQILLLAAVPVLFLSVYYQKFVERKWCPVCLVIIAIILLELGYILILLRSSFNFSMQSLIVFGFVFTTVILIWSAIKKLLTLQKELKEFQIKGNRFMRNYEIFKNTLLASSPIEENPIQSGVILLGNVDSPLKIIVVTSPFCGFCEQAHTIIEEIIEKYPKKVCFDIRFNFDDANTYNNQKSKKVHQQLVSIYFNQGQKAFMKALHRWFENKDENKFTIIENSEINEFVVNQILAEQFNWNKVNQINYTPAIIINGYFIPKQYDKSDLIHFVNDLYEDEDFNK